MSADERRDLLLDPAIRVMASHGVAAGTTRAIAGEAGMGVSVFHYCFHSRDDLVAGFAVADDAGTQRTERIR